MKRTAYLLTSFALVFSVLLGLNTSVSAQRRSDRETRDIIRSLNSKIDDFRYSIDYQLKSSSSDATMVGEIRDSVRDLKQTISDFESNLNQRRENSDDVADIIDASAMVESFLSEHPQGRKIDDDWNGIRSLIDRLASSYGVQIDKSIRPSRNPQTSTNQNYPSTATADYSVGHSMNGTYSIDLAQSERVADVLANTNVSGSNRQDIESKLEAPEKIAISVNGDRVTLASTKAAPVTIVADGQARSENVNGRTVSVRSTLRGSELSVASVGGETDYTIVFSSVDGGRSLKVTRRITTEYLKETIFAESFYTKTDGVAKLGIENDPTARETYSSNDPSDRGSQSGGAPSIGLPRTGEFLVPDGTVVSGVLENAIDTKVSQNSDRFRLTVQTPDQFRGATIEGYISGVGRSGQISGRSNVTFNFERITLRNGKSYDFAGTLQGVKDAQGKEVKVDTEGTAKGDSQTKESLKRGGLGAGAGAIIGAIIGGGKGAAIGAVIGGGAGAGSVAVQGRNDVRLPQGSELTIRSSSPIRHDATVKTN